MNNIKEFFSFEKEIPNITKDSGFHSFGDTFYRPLYSVLKHIVETSFEGFELVVGDKPFDDPHYIDIETFAKFNTIEEYVYGEPLKY